MNREEISWVRQMMREHYDRVLMRGEELEETCPMFSYVKIPSFFFGDTHIRILDGYEMRPPLSIRDEINHIKKELKYWSAVHEDVEDEV